MSGVAEDDVLAEFTGTACTAVSLNGSARSARSSAPDAHQYPRGPAAWVRLDWSVPDVRDETRCGLRDRCEQLRDEGEQVSEAVRTGAQHDDRDVEPRKALLEREIPIHSDEYLELSFRQAEQLPVLDRNQRISRAVLTSWPTTSCASRQSTHSSTKTLTKARLPGGPWPVRRTG